MEEISIKINKNVDLSNSMVILGFPTIGLIGSIAANYIVNSLNLEQIGSIHSKYFMPSLIIHDSKPVHPVRIYYAGEEICKKNNDCNHLIVIVSEFHIPPTAVYPMIDELHNWADDNKISFFLGLEGLKSIDKKEDQVDVYGVGSTPKMIEILEKYGIEKIKEGLISGFTGAFLLSESEKNKDMLCMLTEAHSAYPDSRAAGRLLEKVDEMLPGVKLNLEPLFEEAEKLEKKIKQYMQQSQQITKSEENIAPEMYR